MLVLLVCWSVSSRTKKGNFKQLGSLSSPPSFWGWRLTCFFGEIVNSIQDCQFEKRTWMNCVNTATKFEYSNINPIKILKCTATNFGYSNLNPIKLLIYTATNRVRKLTLDINFHATWHILGSFWPDQAEIINKNPTISNCVYELPFLWPNYLLLLLVTEKSVYWVGFLYYRHN